MVFYVSLYNIIIDKFSTAEQTSPYY